MYQMNTTAAMTTTTTTMTTTLDPEASNMTAMGLTLKSAKKGPDYTKRTAARRNHVPALGLYMSDPLTAGNSKLDKSMLIMDLLAVSTCLNCQDCKGLCYAMKAQRQYPGTYNRRAILTWLARYDLRTLELLIMKQLTTTTRRIVRIHSAGDFLSQAYVDMWSRIVTRFPGIRFYTYTKVDGLLDFSALKACDNFNMVESVLPDGSINFGSLDYIRAKAKAFKAAICPYGISKHAVHCGAECKACLTKKNVLFLVH